MASLASSSDRTSTSSRRLKPPTRRACLMAAVMDPAHAISMLLSHCVSPMRTMGPNMIILEHDHAREIMPVRVDPTHKHPVLLDETKACVRIVSSRGPRRYSRMNAPGVVFRVPAMTPVYPAERARSLMCFDLVSRRWMSRHAKDGKRVRTSSQYHCSALGD